jgi:uncharacterized protein DUF4190
VQPTWPGSNEPATKPSEPWAPPTTTPWEWHAAGAPPAPRTEPLAVASLVASLAQPFVPFFSGIVAIVCGHLARGRIRRAGGRTTGSGLALAGLILGYVGTALFIAGVATLVTVVAVFHDDWARHDARRQARNFAEQLELVSAQTGGGTRDADTIVRAWAAHKNTSTNVDVALADGIDVVRATNADWERAGWRMQFSVHDLGTGHACLTIPTTRQTMPVITDGTCASSLTG